MKDGALGNQSKVGALGEWMANTGALNRRLGFPAVAAKGSIS